MKEDDDCLPFKYGIPAIAEYFRMPTRKAYYLASKGLLPGVCKMGRGWALDTDVARESMRAKVKMEVHV